MSDFRYWINHYSGDSAGYVYEGRFGDCCHISGGYGEILCTRFSSGYPGMYGVNFAYRFVDSDSGQRGIIYTEPCPQLYRSRLAWLSGDAEPGSEDGFYCKPEWFTPARRVFNGDCCAVAA